MAAVKYENPHHIKGCEINVSVEIKYFLVVLSHLCKKLVCWLISFWQKESAAGSWGLLSGPLIFSQPARIALLTQTSHSELYAQSPWVQLTHNLLHFTSPNFTWCSNIYISRLTQWHRLYIQFPRRSLERSWHKLQSLLTRYFFTTAQRKCSCF